MTDTSIPNPSDPDGEHRRPRLSLKRNRGAHPQDADVSSPVSGKCTESSGDTAGPRKKIKLALKPSDAGPEQAKGPLPPGEPIPPLDDEKSRQEPLEREASQPDGLAASPPDAPVHHGPVKRRKSRSGLIIVFILVLALLGLGIYFALPLLQEMTTPEGRGSESSEVPIAPEPGATPAVDPLTPVDDAVAPVREAPAETSDATPAAPVVQPNSNVAAWVDALQIAMARPHADEPIIVVAGVVYAPGMLVDPEQGIRFVGFTPERREVIFEDERGARYYRYF